MKRKPDYEHTLGSQLEYIGCPQPIYEYRFAPPRRWRFDLAWPIEHLRIAVEVEGGLYIRGRHNRASGYTKDMEKYNAAAKFGWRVLRYTPQQVKTWEAAQEIASIILGREVRIG